MSRRADPRLLEPRHLLHVQPDGLYCDDIGVHGSSVNRTFGDELMRPRAGSRVAASLRSLDPQGPLAA